SPRWYDEARCIRREEVPNIGQRASGGVNEPHEHEGGCWARGGNKCVPCDRQRLGGIDTLQRLPALAAKEGNCLRIEFVFRHRCMSETGLVITIHSINSTLKRGIHLRLGTKTRTVETGITRMVTSHSMITPVRPLKVCSSEG